MNVNDFVGQRCLMKTKGVRDSYFRDSSGVEEYMVLEVSPSGNWVRLQNAYGNKFWRPVTDVSLVEVLKSLRPEPPPTTAGPPA